MAFKKDSFQNDTFQIFTYGKALVGSILSSGAIVKRNIYKVLTSNVLFVENMIISKHCFRTLAGTATFMGNTHKRCNRLLIGTVSFSGKIIKTAWKALTGHIISHGSLRNIQTIQTIMKAYFLFRNAFSGFLFRKPKIYFNKEDK